MRSLLRALPDRRALIGLALLLGSSLPVAAQTTYDSTAVTVAGRGPVTYVLVTGLMGGPAGFDRLESQLLAAGHRVIVVDTYRLSVDSAEVTFAAMARRLDRILEQHDVDSARVVAHAHGAGVALRLAASSPQRVSHLYMLEAGALAVNKTRVFSASMRLIPFITRLPGGRRFVRRKILNGIRENSGRLEWFDEPRQRVYSEPMLDNIGKVIALAGRLARAQEPEPLAAVVSRVRAPVTVILGGAPHPSSAGEAEMAGLAPLGAQLTVHTLPGVGHFPHEEATADVARHVLGTAASSATR